MHANNTFVHIISLSPALHPRCHSTPAPPLHPTQCRPAEVQNSIIIILASLLSPSAIILLFPYDDGPPCPTVWSRNSQRFDLGDIACRRKPASFRFSLARDTAVIQVPAAGDPFWHSCPFLAAQRAMGVESIGSWHL